MHCPQCGTPVIEGARFCVACGSDTRAAAAPTTSQPFERATFDRPQWTAAGSPAALPPQASPAFASPPEFQYAGFWMRFLAVIIDIIFFVPVYLLLVGAIVLTTGWQAIPEEPEITPSFLMFELLIILIIAAAYAGFESSPMQGTPGKKVLGLAVTDIRGNRISFLRGLGRFFGRYLSSIILFFGYIMVAFTPKKQGLHDILAGTLVIRKKT